MTRLTLYWHLRTIVEGTTDEAYTTGSGEYAAKDGRVCDAYATGMASSALHSDDAVAYLDAVAHDPAAPLDWRTDAEDLLSTHIMERRLRCYDEKRSISDTSSENTEMRNAFITARRDGDLPQPSMQADYWWSVRCPTCGEGEVLYDWDNDEPRCHCGTEMPLPAYP